MYATITSSVVLSNTSPAWVFLTSISCLMPASLREELSWIKAGMILLSLLGFSIIAYEDRDARDSKIDNPILGDVLSLLSAICYAFYATYLKVKVPEEKESDFKFAYFLGFVGLINDILLLPLMLVFHVTGFETFEWPERDTLVLMSVNALIGTFFSDYCWAQSVVLLGPLVTTLGITITFPISGFYDRFANG